MVRRSLLGRVKLPWEEDVILVNIFHLHTDNTFAGLAIFHVCIYIHRALTVEGLIIGRGGAGRGMHNVRWWLWFFSFFFRELIDPAAALGSWQDQPIVCTVDMLSSASPCRLGDARGLQKMTGGAGYKLHSTDTHVFPQEGQSLFPKNFHFTRKGSAFIILFNCAHVRFLLMKDF